MIRIRIPYHLQNLAGTGAEIQVEVAAPVTVVAVIRAVEARYPMLRGAILDHEHGARRAKIRFFAGGEDISHEGNDFKLPVVITSGKEPFMIVGAISGG